MLDDGSLVTGIGAATSAAPLVLLGLGVALLRGAPQASPLHRQGRPRRRGRGPRLPAAPAPPSRSGAGSGA
jgi:hypothetical protein